MVSGPPFVCRRDEDGGTFHHSSFNVTSLLFVHHQHVVGIQLDSILHFDRLHLQTVVEHLYGTVHNTKNMHTS